MTHPDPGKDFPIAPAHERMTEDGLETRTS